MKRATVLSVLAMSTAATTAAAQHTAAVAQLTRGVADSFGPGFTALSMDRVQFQLSRPANVILLWVSSDGSIDLYYPLRSGDRNARKAGRNALATSRRVPHRCRTGCCRCHAKGPWTIFSNGSVRSSWKGERGCGPRISRR